MGVSGSSRTTLLRGKLNNADSVRSLNTRQPAPDSTRCLTVKTQRQNSPGTPLEDRGHNAMWGSALGGWVMLEGSMQGYHTRKDVSVFVPVLQTSCWISIPAYRQAPSIIRYKKQNNPVTSYCATPHIHEICVSQRIHDVCSGLWQFETFLSGCQGVGPRRKLSKDWDNFSPVTVGDRTSPSGQILGRR